MAAKWQSIKLVTVTCGYLVDEATRSYWKLFEATVTELKLDEATCLILSLLFSVYHCMSLWHSVALSLRA